MLVHVCVCPHSKPYTAQAINTELDRHAVHDSVWLGVSIKFGVDSSSHVRLECEHPHMCEHVYAHKVTGGQSMATADVSTVRISILPLVIHTRVCD